MKILSLLFLTFLAVACEKKPFGPKATIRGMAIAVDNKMTDAEIKIALEEVKKIGANAVLIKTSEIQDNWKASFIYPDPEETLSLQKLTFTFREARKLGFQIAFMPILILKKTAKSTEWRGMIVPENLARWVQSYRSMVLKYAEIASEEQIHFFGVGSELVSMEFYTDVWKELIHDVRKSFSGKLFYSSNWDYLSVNPAWKELDMLGLNAYYELAKKGENPSIEVLETRWQNIRKTAEKWADDFEKPILMTEVGYPSRLDGLSDPWDHIKTAPVDLAVQQKGYEAFLRSWEASSALYGVFFYEWLGNGGELDPSYTPKNKPSLKILQKWMHRDETAILRF